MERPLVIRRDHRDRLDAEVPARSEHAERDLAAVRDEELSDQAFFPD